MSDSKKILIIRLSSIGDILLTTPFIRQTRKAFPNFQIDFIIKKEYSELIENNTHLDNIIKFGPETGLMGLKELRNSLLKNKYDYVFDLHNNMRSNFLRRKIKSNNKYYIKKHKLFQILYVMFKINRYPEIISIADRYLNVGKLAGIEDDGEGIELFWKKNNEEFIQEIFKENGISAKDQIFAIAPGAGFFTKRWPIEYYQNFVKNILEKYQCKVVVLGDEYDKYLGEILATTENVIDLCGKLTLLQSAVVLSKSRALVSNDTGLMHMATAVKTPVLAIFGSTVEEFGFFPYRSKSLVVENNNLNCRPCSHIGRHNCPRSHFKCMQEITPEIIAENFEKLLRK